jgi:hypothetical protein
MIRIGGNAVLLEIQVAPRFQLRLRLQDSGVLQLACSLLVANDDVYQSTLLLALILIFELPDDICTCQRSHLSHC